MKYVLRDNVSCPIMRVGRRKFPEIESFRVNVITDCAMETLPLSIINTYTHFNLIIIPSHISFRLLHLIINDPLHDYTQKHYQRRRSN